MSGTTMANNRRYYFLLLTLFVFHVCDADTVKILEWNISGSELSGNSSKQNAAAEIFDSEDADIIALQETSRGSSAIASILTPNYIQAVAIDGQEIWLRDNDRFVVESTGTWSGACNTMKLDGASSTIRDRNSASRLFLYSAHFCIPDTFAGTVDVDPNVSNEDQQGHLCNIIDDMEVNAALGTVVMAADFDDINIPAGESLIDFLQGTGSLNGGFCTTSSINMVDIVTTDVTHIMGSGGAVLYSAAATARPSFGQHGYVVASVDLGSSESDAAADSGVTAATDGSASSALISGRVSVVGSDDSVTSVINTREIEITGIISPAQEHLGQSGSLYVVLVFQGQRYFKDAADSFSNWNGELEELGAYRESIMLDTSLDIDVFAGRLSGLQGSLEIHFAYSLQGVFYYNLTPLRLEITSP